MGVAAAEKEKILVGLVKTKLITVLETLDEDGNGTISKDEFDELINIPEATLALDELGVGIQNLSSLADHLFEGEEPDNHSGAAEKKEGTMTFAEFLEMVIRLRAENTPCVADIVELRKLIHKGQKTMQRKVNQLEKGQLTIQRGIRMVSEQLDSTLSLWEEMSVSMNNKKNPANPKWLSKLTPVPPLNSKQPMDAPASSSVPSSQAPAATNPQEAAM